jgi:WD40 repeat protein
MKPLKPDGRIDLEHRAYYLRGSPEKAEFIAASEDGHVSLVNLASKSARLHRPTTNLRAISPHPSEPLFALVDGVTGSLVIQTIDSKKIAQVEPPRIKEGASKSITPGFANCHFDETGDFLWVLAPVNDDECELSLVETKGWSVVQCAAVEDQFGVSAFSFHCTGKPGLVSLWIAAGQDGQQVYWLKREGVGFSLKKVDELTNCIPPVFSPDGSEFLVVTEDNSICRYAFARTKQIGSPLESGDEDNPFAESLCYVEDRRAIVGTGEGRIFLVETEKLRIEEEVAIEGHEPRPIGEYYSTLAKERGLGTDITWFTGLGSVIIFVFRRDRGKGLNGWKDSLLWYSVKK